jgi:rhamnulose-1-phosphate aldolase
MEILDYPLIKEFMDTCLKGYDHGRHERNGGNLSYRLKDEEVSDLKGFFKEEADRIDLGTTIENIKNEYFLFTGSGKFFGSIDRDTEEKIGIIKISEDGKKYKIVRGFENGNKPTSELPTHLLNHAVKKEKTKGTYRVIYHSHTTNLIAMTFILPSDRRLYSRILWEMATECPIVYPDGVGLIDRKVPGSVEIGVASSELMKDFDVILWSHHGTFCAGKTLEETFGLMETVEKSAEIYMKILASGMPVVDSITTEGFIDLAKDFGVSLNPAVLDYEVRGEFYGKTIS